MRRVVVSSIVVGVVGVAVVVFVLLVGRGETREAGRATAPSTAPATPSQEEAHEVAVALERLATDPDSLVASTAREQVGGRAREAVPSGSTVTVDERSWSPDGAGGGVIALAVTSPGRGTTNYAAIMLSEGDEWKVLATVPIATRAPATSAEPTR